MSGPEPWERPRNPQWWAALLVAGLAVVLRVANLGTFSLWLDEVFTMRVAAKPLAETLALCAADAENVPLYAVVANLGLKLGLGDPWIRLLPIAAGLISIWLLAVWSHRNFGRTVSVIVAVFCAVSPFHIRYSQELRAYPYLLLMCAATLRLTDRLRERPDWKSTLGLAIVVGLGFYTNLTYVLVLVPTLGLILMSTYPSGFAGPVCEPVILRRYAFAVALGTLSFTPWIWRIWPSLMSRLSRPRTTGWTLAAIGDRWECLTIAPGQANLLSWFGAGLGVLVLAGIVVAAGMRIGRLVLLPALITLIVWEVVLVQVEHWSSPRYDTALWPFLVVLLALGFERFLRLLRFPWIRTAVSATVVILLLLRVDAYHRRGRPHWDQLAREVRDARRPGEKVVTMDHFSRICLAYYLKEHISTINQEPQRLRAELAERRSVLFVSRGRLRPELSELAGTRDLIANVHRTAKLFRLGRAPRPGGDESRPLSPD